MALSTNEDKDDALFVPPLLDPVKSSEENTGSGGRTCGTLKVDAFRFDFVGELDRRQHVGVVVVVRD